jgi:hypothetical protein
MDEEGWLGGTGVQKCFMYSLRSMSTGSESKLFLFMIMNVICYP